MVVLVAGKVKLLVLVLICTLPEPLADNITFRLPFVVLKVLPVSSKLPTSQSLIVPVELRIGILLALVVSVPAEDASINPA